MADQPFHDRHVVVTGGTGALGIAVVGALLEAGASCHVPYIHPAEASRFPHREDARVTLVADLDLSDERSVTRLYAGVPKLWASIHLAGGFAYAPIGETSPADLRRQVDMNFTTCFLCCRAAIAALGAGGGRIVNVAARPALESRLGANMTAYTASKAAVAALTIALAEEVAGKDILVNAIAPSILDTPANRQAMPKADHATWPKVEEVARTILFLASPDNKVTRGAIVPVYGKA
ncbi:MAG TPA: SDR family NAD(P)-dependent oxidoreductase [Xanthobacteraceae bacterium]|jgi:NAD(P)-dependent dehydrogenase (short-subunit alcohol dehydrogenase family)|nr:SDR family NAD(P)-dependent oxidoreductase [Xanthobacteraceae bacterium]